MKVKINEKITVFDASPEIMAYVKKNLTIANPIYRKNLRLGYSVYKVPKDLILYETIDDHITMPFGCLRDILPMIKHADNKHEFLPIRTVDFGGDIPLYDYQQNAVDVCVGKKFGILQAPAGSGKTRMGLAIAKKISGKTLWVTHTKDLLQQSKERASMYFDSSKFGEITEGKIKIGNTITFATVRTLSNIMLPALRKQWDCVIVDECHRVAGTPTSVTRFSKVLNSLCCKYKYGLSATVHRADGLIKATYSLLGPIIHTVSDSAVADKVMKVSIKPVMLNTYITDNMIFTDGMLNYPKMISELCADAERNKVILSDLIDNADHYCLILSDRLSHLEYLYNHLPDELKEQAVYINGKTTNKKTKAARVNGIEQMRQGEKRFLFASYSLAKEGLDIPRLDRLFLATPQKDYAIITRSIGRIARTYEGKSDPIAYDYVDGILFLERAYKKRITTYKKHNCRILESRFER